MRWIWKNFSGHLSLIHILKRIFLLANEGKSPRTIAELLTEEKVLIPAAYAKKYHLEQYNGTKFSNPYLWGTSSVRTILGRQEYLGHTVLRKSVSTNFKLHKRKETDEDEQYVFQNTHEPIISQELWDSVQKRRCRVNRASAWGTHTNRLSGYLYCADCGRRLTLQTHYSLSLIHILDDAQEQIEQLQVELRRFKTELSDVEIAADLQVTVDSFLKFADFFFDAVSYTHLDVYKRQALRRK